MLESLLIKLKAFRLQHKCFPVNILKLLGNSHFEESLIMAASVSKSSLSSRERLSHCFEECLGECIGDTGNTGNDQEILWVMPRVTFLLLLDPSDVWFILLDIFIGFIFHRSYPNLTKLYVAFSIGSWH